MQVTVLPADRTIVVNGVALKCEFDPPEGVQSIHWAGAEGVGQMTGGAAHGLFRNPGLIAPYVAAWRTAMQARIAATEADEPIEQAAYQAYVAAEAQRNAERIAAAQAEATVQAAAAEEAAKQQVTG